MKVIQASWTVSAIRATSEPVPTCAGARSELRGPRSREPSRYAWWRRRGCPQPPGSHRYRSSHGGRGVQRHEADS